MAEERVRLRVADHWPVIHNWAQGGTIEAPELLAECRDVIAYLGGAPDPPAEGEARIRAVADELVKIEAELEDRDEGWMATRVSYCAGALKNLLAYPPDPPVQPPPDQGGEDG